MSTQEHRNRLFAALLALTLTGVAGVLIAAFVGGSLGAVVAPLLAAFGLLLLWQSREAAPDMPVRQPVEARNELPAATRALVEGLHDPVLVLDAEGRIVIANRAADALLGPDVARKRISSVLRTPELLESIERALKGGEEEAVAFAFLVPVERHYRAHIASTRALPDCPPFVLVQIHDLTEMRRAEEMRADFVANASHELRTPLAALSGFIDTLRGHAKNDAAARDRFLDIMSVEAGRMRRLIDDLLSLTRIELNEHVPPSGEGNVVAILRDAATALSPLAEADDVKIDIADHPPLMVTCERDELIQVFQNLLHNAIKYGRPQGTVRVSFGRGTGPGGREPGDEVFVSVQDEGEGIAREAIPRLTERFYRVDVKRSREKGGTGLGLAIVKHILNRHHGRLFVESTPGVGSIFTVVLPPRP